MATDSFCPICGNPASDERKKFQAFMEIRNQIMHNLEASTYEKCCSYLNGVDKFLLKIYPHNEERNQELRLEKACLKLAEDVISLDYQIIEKVKDKFGKEFKLDLYTGSNFILIIQHSFLPCISNP